MIRLLALLLLVVLSACGDRPPATTERQIEVDVVQPGVRCRVAKNGGPLHADRGIGGTGASFGDHLSDRGIGGTGIVGVVTGFASICVNGLEVRYDSDTPVDIDGSPSSATKLRVGQVVAVRAVDPAGSAALPAFARVITVRTEIAGPIEAVHVGTNVMTIAGQRVVVAGTTWGANRFGLGDWTAVSGLRQADGTIAASRLDDTPAGRLFLRGMVSRHDGAAWIAGLRLTGAAAGSLRDGDYVTVSGTYQAGQAQVASVAPDTMAATPTAYFGNTVNQLVMQAFVAVDDSAVWLNERVKVTAAPALRQNRPTSGDAIVTMERQPDGKFVATGLRYTKYPTTSDLDALAHAWHVTSHPLPLPPVPPAASPLMDLDEPGAVPAALPGGRGRVPQVAPDPEAPGGDNGEELETAPPALVSCAACAPFERYPLPRLRRGVARPARGVLAAAKGPSGRAIPASMAVFTTSNPQPGPHGDTPGGH